MRPRRDPVQRRLSEDRFQVSLVWEGLLVGLFGGFVIALYRLALAWAERTVRHLTSVAAGDPLLVAGWFCMLAVMALVVGFLVKWEPDTSGSGIPQVDAEVMGAKSMKWHKVLVAKFIEGTLTALGGLSMGREGPSVQLGGMVGKGVSRLLGRGRGEERLLVTCGAGAGMAAAFHAPLTGVMFALEEIHKTFSAPLIISAMTSAVASDYIASSILGLSPAVAFELTAFIPHAVYALLIPFGVVMGLVGAAHNLGMYFAQDVFSKVRVHAPYLRLLIPFALAGIAAFAMPQLMDGGDAILELLEEPAGLPVFTLLALLVGKYVFTCICFGSGAPGGTLFPLVVMGALVGALLGICLTSLLGVAPELIVNFMVLGIAGMFAGAIRAPVTAVVLAFELTGSLHALLSLSIVSVFAYVTANLLSVDAYYEHLLGKLLGVSAEEAHGRWGADGRQLHTYTVEAGSKLCGSCIKDVSWPERALIVTVSRFGADIVPHGDTTLEAGDEILVLLDERSGDHAESRIRGMCRGSFSG